MTVSVCVCDRERDRYIYRERERERDRERASFDADRQISVIAGCVRIQAKATPLLEAVFGIRK